MQWDTSYCVFLIVTTIYKQCSSAEVENQQLRQLVDEVWTVRLKEAPEFATKMGYHGHNDVLEDYSQNAFDRRKVKYTDLISKIDAFDQQYLSKTDKVTLILLRDGLQRYVDGYKWRNYSMANPINFMEIVKLGTMPAAPFTTENDFTNYISRLRGLKIKIDQAMDLMRISIQMKTANHNVSMRLVPGRISRFYTNMAPESVSLYKPFETSLDLLNISMNTKKALKEEGLAVIRNVVQPAFRNLSHFITEVYMPSTRKNIGVSSLPNGTEFYEACLRWHLTLDLTPEEVHQLGLKEVSRIESEMNRIKDNLRFSGTLNEFMLSLRKDPKQYYKTEDEVLSGYRNVVINRTIPRLSEVFRNYPDLPVEIRRSQTDGSTGKYTDPPVDGSRSGIFWVNSRHPEKRGKFFMVALSLHEVSPGHHLQSSYAITANLPLFRRLQDFGRYFAVPFNFPFYTGFLEGWGLYAEFLGEEMGVYKDDYERFGRLTSEMFRACRLVIDTGLHVKGWGRQQAIDYMARYVSLPDSQIQFEIDRYITLPGQACAYKIGELKIKELRRKAENMLGSAFAVEDFHNVILTEGAVPLNILEESVNAWIKERKNRSAVPMTSGAECNNLNVVKQIICLSILFYYVNGIRR